MDVEEAPVTPIKINTCLKSSPPESDGGDFSPLKKVSKTSAELPSPRSAAHSAQSPSERQAERDKRALNLSLENAMQFTLRADAATNGVVLLEQQDAAVGEFINPGNVSMLIFARLSEQSADIPSAVSYLVGCYKRLQTKELSAAPKVQEDLAK